MSVHIMALIYRVRLGCPLRKAVALKLADCADDEGQNIWPSVATIADQAEIAERTTQKKLAELLALKVLHVVKYGGGRRRTTFYRYDLPKLYDLAAGRVKVSEVEGKLALVPVAPDAAENPAPGAPFPEKKGAPRAPFPAENPAPRAPFSDERVHATTEKGAPGAPNPSEIHHLTHSHESQDAARACVSADATEKQTRSMPPVIAALQAEGVALHVVEHLIARLFGVLDMGQRDPLPFLRGIRDELADFAGEVLTDTAKALRGSRTRWPSPAQARKAAQAALQARPPLRVQAGDPAFAAWLRHYREQGKHGWAAYCEQQGHVAVSTRYPPVARAATTGNGDARAGQ